MLTEVKTGPTFDIGQVRLSLASAVALAVLLLSSDSAISQSESAFAHKFIAEAKEIKSLHGHASRQSPIGDRIVWGGDVTLPTSKPYQGESWIACTSADGHILWSARAQEQPEAASLFPLTTDGDWIWNGGLLKTGIFQLAKFDAKSLRKAGSVQIAVEPTKDNAPYIQLHSDEDRNFDLQVSLVQAGRDSVRVAVFSRDLRVLIDKIYPYPAANSRSLAGAYLARIPDRSGYYLFLRRPLRSERNSGIAIIRLDNGGAVKWANLYAAGSPDQEVEPHETSDGCILLNVPHRTARSSGSLLIKIGSEGNVNWAVTTEGMTLDLADFNFPWIPYRFIDPYLFAMGMRFASGKLSCSVLAINYQTGKIEKQVACNFPGAIGFTEKSSDSLYVTLLDQSMSGRSKSQAAVLRFDFDLNLRAAKSIRNAEPHWPIFHTLMSGKFLFSYSYHDQRTVVAETTDANFESANSCSALQKANLTVARSNLAAQPVNVASMPLPSITASEAKSQTSEANLQLQHFDLTASPCR